MYLRCGARNENRNGSYEEEDMKIWDQYARILKQKRKTVWPTYHETLSWEYGFVFCFQMESIKAECFSCYVLFIWSALYVSNVIDSGAKAEANNSKKNACATILPVNRVKISLASRERWWKMCVSMSFMFFCWLLLFCSFLLAVVSVVVGFGAFARPDWVFCVCCFQSTHEECASSSFSLSHDAHYMVYLLFCVFLYIVLVCLYFDMYTI